MDQALLAESLKQDDNLKAVSKTSKFGQMFGGEE